MTRDCRDCYHAKVLAKDVLRGDWTEPASLKLLSPRFAGPVRCAKDRWTRFPGHYKSVQSFMAMPRPQARDCRYWDAED